jgi:hypothetical protein
MSIVVRIPAPLPKFATLLMASSLGCIMFFDWKTGSFPHVLHFGTLIA